MEDLRVVENQPAEFICQYSRPVKAQWKKDGQPLQPDGRRVVVEQDWNVARLYISHVSAEDRGTYSCEAEGTCVVASLHVEGELPSTWKKHQALGDLLCFFPEKRLWKKKPKTGLLLIITAFLLLVDKGLTVLLLSLRTAVLL